MRIYTNPRTSDSAKQPVIPGGVPGGKSGETTAQGGDIQTRSGIHLIANYETGQIEGISAALANTLYGGPFNKVQPMVRGDLLVACLKDIIEDINNLADVVSDFANAQMKFNTRLGAHTHTVAGAIPGTAIPDVSSLVPWWEL